MKSIINKIFCLNGYEEKHVLNDKNMIFYAIENKDYYSVYFVDELDNDALLKIKNMIKKLNSNIFTKEQKSNNTVLICAKVCESNLKPIQKNIVFDIEEDTLNFKKYVLWYTDKEINFFKHYYYDNINTSDDISSLACESYNEFENFKKNMYLEHTEEKNNKKQLNKQDDINRNIAYSFLLRLIIKIPFLVLNYLPPLEKDINMYIKNELEGVKTGLSEVLNMDYIEDQYIEGIILDLKDKNEINKKLLEFSLEER